MSSYILKMLDRNQKWFEASQRRIQQLKEEIEFEKGKSKVYAEAITSLEAQAAQEDV